MIQIALPSLIIRLMFINWVSIFSLFLRLKKKKKKSQLFLENWSLPYLYTHCSPKSGCALREFFQGQDLGWYVVTCDDHKNFKISSLYWQLLFKAHLHDLGELQKGFLHFSNKRLSVSFSHKTINVTLK